MKDGHASPPSDRDRRAHLGEALSCVAVVPWVIVVTGLLEVLPAGVAAARRFTAVAFISLVGQSAHDQIVVCWQGFLAFLAVAIAHVAAGAEPRRARACAALAALAGLVVVWSAYERLIEYPRFAAHRGFLVAYCTVGVLLAAAYAIPLVRRHPPARLLGGIALLAACGFIVGQLTNIFFVRDHYPTLAASITTLTLAFLHVALWGAMRWLAWSNARRIGVLAVGAVLVVICTFLPLPRLAAPYYASRASLASYVARQRAVEATCVAGSPGPGLPVFTAQMPTLPASLRLGEMNVLFVLIDTLRYDSTSFAVPGSTPALQALIDDGAFAFQRAYAPSVLTLASASAIFSARFPSSAPLSVSRPSWIGELRPELPTLAEIMGRSGYDTYRAVHNIQHTDLDRRGLERGFQQSYVAPSVNPYEPDLLLDWHTDEQIADHALEYLAQVNGPRPFFALVFFGGPHAPYTDNGRTDGDERTRYQREVANTDAQIGRLVGGLRASGQLAKTVIVVAADHGEAFGEHNSYAHARTLYEEAVHVPLVVWIPGVAGGRISTPTSVVFALPWLMRQGPDSMRAWADEAIDGPLGAPLVETGGAIPIELLGSDFMKTAFVTEHQKLIYDHYSDRYELYDLGQDPLEQRDLALEDPAVLLPWSAAVEAYRNGRACRRRYRLE